MIVLLRLKVTATVTLPSPCSMSSVWSRRRPYPPDENTAWNPLAVFSGSEMNLTSISPDWAVRVSCGGEGPVKPAPEWRRRLELSGPSYTWRGSAQVRSEAQTGAVRAVIHLARVSSGQVRGGVWGCPEPGRRHSSRGQARWCHQVR